MVRLLQLSAEKRFCTGKRNQQHPSIRGEVPLFRNSMPSCLARRAGYVFVQEELGVPRAASFACRGMHAWNNRRSKRRRDLTAIAVDGPLHHRAAARRVLEALGFPLPAAAPAGGREP